jgi:hypothetical protein
VLAVILAVAGAAFVVLATPPVTGRPMAREAGPMLLGAALLVVAAAVSWRVLRSVRRARRDVRRGIRQIEMVLELEAALSPRRVTVAGSNAGCPICGAPAGPHCVCRKER